MRFFLRGILGAALLLGALLPGSTLWAQQVSVPVSFHRQEHALSCEIATLKMALGGQGIELTEGTLLAQLPFDPTPKQAGIWGDPAKGFVGNIDGRMLVTGYGVYWEPIAQLGARYVHTFIIQQSSAAQLAKQIALGNPVIIWGNYGAPTVHTWQTPAGKSVRAVNGEHTRVVYGFDGPVSSPTHFYLMDPLYGQLRWSTAELMDNWRIFDHTGVVVTGYTRWVRIPGETKVWELSSIGTTRQWVTTWATLARRGGTDKISNIDHQRLAAYSVGRPIE